MIPLTNNSSTTTQLLTLTLGGAAGTYPTATVYSYIVPPQTKTVTSAQGYIAGDPSEYRRAPEFTLLTAATKTTISAAPPSGSVKIITGVTIYNPDTASITATVAIDDNGTSRVQCKVTLLTLESLYYENGRGWYAMDANGNIKEAAATVVDASTVATQAQQETATATNVIVTPGRQQFHPSAAKAWIYFDGTGSGTVKASYNCTLTRNGAGDYTVNFTTSFSSANYSGVMTAGDTGVTLGIVMWVSQTSAAFRFTTNSAVPAAQDSGHVFAAFYGDQ